MCQDKQTPINLTIADSKLDLRVISFTGREALNEPYRFEVELISPDPRLNFRALLRRDAFLAFGNDDEGIHGQIDRASQLHAGASLSHYRIGLVPRLHALQQRTQRRMFHNLSVPQIIVRLLEEHGINASHYRFEKTVGLYPGRPVCTQYDETDLHLLQRLCEEEGIHFHFEHSRNGHVLVFADDPASFPDLIQPVHFQRIANYPGITHLTQWHTLHRSYSSHKNGLFGPYTDNITDPEPRDTFTDADNQPFEPGPHPGQPADQRARRRQITCRTLERLRCERGQVDGHSNQPSLVCGNVMQVLGHPDQWLNDQWLLTAIHHAGKQPQLLEGWDPHDIAAIAGPAPRDTDYHSPLTEQRASSKQGMDIPPFSHGYRNRFSVIPWAIPFRPSLKHPKPAIQGAHPATLTGNVPDEQGRVPIRLDWQQTANCTPDSESDREPASVWASALGGLQLDRAKAGTRVLVGHFDDDPDQPLVCALLSGADRLEPPSALLDMRLDGVAVDPQATRIHIAKGQKLGIDATTTLTLELDGTRFEIDNEHIRIQMNTAIQVIPARRDQLRAAPVINDLRLTTEPGLKGAPVSNQVWYIVQMHTPGLEHLARLHLSDFLFEGKTDNEGYLGLTGSELRHLSGHYHQQPRALCLIHPGHCVLLHTWFEQNWSEQQREAFLRLSE